jgi:hypothetical protein
VQICCKFDETYDDIQKKCIPCTGKVNNEGTLCCANNQYFSYSISGQPSCVNSCVEEQMYKTEYCCSSLSSSSCQIHGLLPTFCNPAYYIDGACQSCPNFCSLTGIQASICTTSSQNVNCNKSCDPGTVYTSNVSQCLTCD